MEKIDQLEQHVRNLSLAVRLGVAVVTAAFTVQCCIVLSQAPNFQQIFEDLLGGMALPPLTVFFMTFSIPITIGAVVMALLIIAGLFVLPRKPWCIPLGILVAIVIIAVTQLAVFSFQLPLLQIISQLSG